MLTPCQMIIPFKYFTGTIEDMNVSENGELCCSISDDKTAKVFDVINFG